MAVETRISLSHWGAFVTEVTDGRLTGVKPFPGSIEPSPMIGAWPELVYSPSRIAGPMVRRGFLEGRRRDGRGGDPFVAVSWDAALDLVASELHRVRGEHGNQAIFGGSYGWSSAGRYHHARSQVRRFLFSFGGCVDQVGNYSWGAAQFILPHVIGSYRAVSEDATAWSTIVEAGDLVVAFGGLNPKNWRVTAGGAGEHGIGQWTRRAVENGVQFVVIGPLREDAPDWLRAEWMAPRPNTDTAIMLGLAHTLVAEGLHDASFVERYCVGFGKFHAYLMGETDGRPKDADWAAAIAGVPADELRRLARRMAAARTMLTASWSLQRGDHGEQPYWALIALAALLGQIGLPGGGFSFGYGSLNGIGAPRSEALTPSLSMPANPLDRAIPVARVADMLLAPGETIDFNGRRVTYPDIRLVYWAGGNPFHHHQDLNRLLAAWEKPETIVVHDTWWTPTARRADIVLPATTSLERNDIGGSTRDRYVFAMPKVIEPVGGARDDADIFGALAERLDCADACTEGRDEMAWIRHIYDGLCGRAQTLGIEVPGFDDFWRKGYWQAPEPENAEVLLGDFRDNPQSQALATPSGRIELFSDTIAGFAYADCPPHPAWLPPAEWLGGDQAKAFPLHLITNQPRNRLHSQMDQTGLGRGDKVAGREPVWINPADAGVRDIGNGDVVRLFNDRGACLAGAVVTEDVRPGVVVMATGAWYDPLETHEPGALEKHGNPNVLTLDKGTSRLAQGCSALSALVQIEKSEGPHPAVTAFEPPEILTS